jgi:hypothetical protein
LVHREVIAAAQKFLARLGLAQPDCKHIRASESSTPLIVTGHQPELFHPGVWVKNFATAALAQVHGGLGINLIVDNDLPKSASIRVPQLSGTSVRAIRVEFDQWKGEAPFEDLPVHDESLFSSFGKRARDVLGAIVSDPILEDYWPRVVRLASENLPMGLRLSLARHELEASWGLCNLEVPLSQLCQTEGFLWFLSHLLAELPRFQEIHNQALKDYRVLYGIRSKNHPVSALAVHGDWHEAPFWVWREGQQHRRPLLVRQMSRTMLLRIADEDEPLVELPLAPDREACCAVEILSELGLRKVRLRMRALTTTMFARYLLGDLFIHGIGGAKYDELGDSIARRFFGIDPPGFMTLSMTLWLGLPDRPLAAFRIASIDHRIRQLVFNPDRALTEPLSPEVRNLIVAKRMAIDGPTETRRQRVNRYRELRAINQLLQPFVGEQLESLRAQRQEALKAQEWDRAARSREYSFVLHSARRLRDIKLGLAQAVKT